MMRSKQVTLALLKCTKINIKKRDKRERNEGIQCEGGNGEASPKWIEQII